MNTENDFNRLLSSQLKKLEPEFYKLKVAEKYHEGISDFFIWGQGRCGVVEVKFIHELPKRSTTNVLSHPFDPVQITFLKNVALTGSGAFGLVALDYERRLRLYRYDKLPAHGNWTREEFERAEDCSLWGWPSEGGTLGLAKYVTSTFAAL